MTTWDLATLSAKFQILIPKAVRTARRWHASQVVAFTATCIVADLDTAVALSAAEISACHKLATADAIIYATARAHNADVLTCDRHFEGLPEVLYVSKPQSQASSSRLAPMKPPYQQPIIATSLSPPAISANQAAITHVRTP
jgi:PIN domain nuclease of toxin-antitoxin system